MASSHGCHQHQASRRRPFSLTYQCEVNRILSEQGIRTESPPDQWGLLTRDELAAMEEAYHAGVPAETFAQSLRAPDTH